MTICRIQRNNAEARIAAMRANGWKRETTAAAAAATKVSEPVTDEQAENTDLEAIARDQIAQLVDARFKGHGLTPLWKRSSKRKGTQPTEAPRGPMVAPIYSLVQALSGLERRACVSK